MTVMTSEIHEINTDTLNNTVLKNKKELNQFDRFGLEQIFDQFLKYVTDQYETDFTDLLVIDNETNTCDVLDGCNNVVFGMLQGKPMAISHAFVTNYGLVVVAAHTFKADEDMPALDTSFNGDYINYDTTHYYSIL